MIGKRGRAVGGRCDAVHTQVGGLASCQGAETNPLAVKLESHRTSQREERDRRGEQAMFGRG